MSIAGTEPLTAGGGGLGFLEMGGDIAARSPAQLFWRRFRRDRVAVVSGIFIVLLIVIAIAAPLVVEILGMRGDPAEDLTCVREFQRIGVQGRSEHELGGRCAVERIGQQGEAQGGGMRPDLVGAPRLRPGGEQGVRLEPFLDVKMGQGRNPPPAVHRGAVAVSDVRA